MFRRTFFIATAATFIASASYADLHIRFMEGAPKDRFVVTNTGACAIEAAQITIDLTGSEAGLIFDVTAAGSGVEVFQPFEIVAGGDYIVRQPSVVDGDQMVALQVSDFGQDKSVAFTIDVDDTAGAREITVSNAELRGASVSVMLGGKQFSTSFTQGSELTLNTGACL
ncbi:aggregation factor core [Falsiphaeobacter marinintestinus]|uniref:aggregation factor core n=1 Tax=Falsiphaeobacter marinintestinus TaxID=1492905 RepID=UPI0011B3C82D|nr:aggregation factor core [Phaeobacter marinintestinus]